VTVHVGSRLGPYEIAAPAGAGGMGEVWQATDTRLDRTVAIKVLPPHLSQEPGLRARLEREARVVSSLNHPNICALFDVGHEDEVDYLVMEYLSGETLAARLRRGPLPLPQALRIGAEIAGALDHAHRAGVVHRDLKPGNVMLTRDGAKLLDFGLAKSPAVGGGAMPQTLVTPAEPLTGKGTLLGTVQYMAPEQLEGKEADARSDIFAFGLVLYEMVTGERAFAGESQASLVSAILRDQPPPISTLVPLSPPALERIVEVCLAKDPEARWHSAHDLGVELRWIVEASSLASSPATRTGARPSRTPWLAWGLLAGALVAAAALAALLARSVHRESVNAERVMRLHLTPPGGERFSFQANLRPFAISPDGSLLAYAAEQGVSTELHLRSMASGDTVSVQGSEGARNPFFSPDGKWIGFAASGKLKKVAVAGGAPAVLCDAPSCRGAVWGDNSFICFSPSMYAPIARVGEGGGEPWTVTRIRADEGELQHRWPELLPGGKVLLYAIGTGADWDEATIVAERLETGERKVLVKGGTYPRYLPTGHLVFARTGALYALPFDARKLDVSGAPVEVADNVLVTPAGCAAMDVSRGGVLVTAPRDAIAGKLAISWIDREGRGVLLKTVEAPLNSIALSPDGRKVALGVGNGISIVDLVRLATTRLTFPARAAMPVWWHDGRRLFVGLEKDRAYNIYSKAADDSGVARIEVGSDAYEEPVGTSKDGSKLLSLRTLESGVRELLVYHLGPSGASRDPTLLLRSPYLEGVGGFSPDGRWVAYQSEESGRREVLVRPSSGEDHKWLLSTEGGRSPVWSTDGKEIFYVCGAQLVAVPVAVQGDELVAGTPKVLFDNHRIVFLDVAPDGKRFLVAEDANPGAPPRLDVVVNWLSEVRRKVDAARTP
jgi:eukaryotic-like serine/threonine-protein kinase